MDKSPFRLDDMRLMAALITARNFTHVAALAGMPKQTVARRVAVLETALGVRLVDRTTRAFRMTALGRVYAERCAEVMRLADETNRAVRGEATEISGTLRVTADPLFGEQFLSSLIAEFAMKNPAVRIEVSLTSRFVDLVDEGFDVAFRVGAPGDGSLIATKIAEASLVLVASREYAKSRGVPASPDDIHSHDVVALAPEGTQVRWAFRADAGSPARKATREGIRWLPVQPRLRVNHLGLARDAALAGLGIANLPYFACSEYVASGALRLVLPKVVAPFGAIYVVHAPHRLVTPRVRAFRDLAVERLRARPELRARKSPSKKTSGRDPVPRSPT